MGKYKLKKILTIIYSAIITTLFCLLVFFIPIKAKINIKESFFLIGLVLVLIGIFLLITKNSIRLNAISKQKAEESNLLDDEEEDNDDEDDDIKKTQTSSFFLGFNSFTVVLTGVFILIVDLFLK